MKKSTKKGNGEGSISKIEKNGKMVWKGTISIGYDENGKLKSYVKREFIRIYLMLMCVLSSLIIGLILK